MKRAIWRRDDEISPLHLYTMDNAELSNTISERRERRSASGSLPCSSVERTKKGERAGFLLTTFRYDGRYSALGVSKMSKRKPFAWRVSGVRGSPSNRPLRADDLDRLLR